MNSEHLFNDEYKNEITQFWNNWKLKKHEFSDLSQWWDIGKMKIKRISRNFSIEQSIKNKSKIADIESEITSLSNSMSDSGKVIELKNQLDELLSKKMKE